MSKILHISRKLNDQELGKIHIPGSKSESNRALLINSLCEYPGNIYNLSTARDTQLMQSLLLSNDKSIDVKDAGTVMRFLTTYFALSNKSKIITGTKRMKERPIKILMDALKTLGVHFEYLNKIGYPPIEIHGFSKQQTNNIHVDGSISSQYLSALLMMAPTLPKGLNINITGNLTSKPYLDMTIAIMSHFNVNVNQQHKKISVAPQTYKYKPFYVEPDWTSASYWYSIFILSNSKQLNLIGYKENSNQGDKILINLMNLFGVQSIFTKDGLILKRKISNLPNSIDFTNNPDLAQTFAVLCAALNHNCTFTGLHTLKIKETNRILALQLELQKINTQFIASKETWKLNSSKNNNWRNKNIVIETYHDHRMAMAFAPLSLLSNNLYIKNPDVVNKSYPTYWEDLKKAGFNITLQ